MSDGKPPLTDDQLAAFKRLMDEIDHDHDAEHAPAVDAPRELVERMVQAALGARWPAAPVTPAPESASLAAVTPEDAADEVLRTIWPEPHAQTGNAGNRLWFFARAVAAYPEALAAGLAAAKEMR